MNTPFPPATATFFSDTDQEFVCVGLDDETKWLSGLAETEHDAWCEFMIAYSAWKGSQAKNYFG